MSMDIINNVVIIITIGTRHTVIIKTEQPGIVSGELPNWKEKITNLRVFSL